MPETFETKKEKANIGQFETLIGGIDIGGEVDFHFW